MSSILDAINKAEEEKAAANAPVDLSIDEDSAERELLGRKVSKGGSALPLTAATLVAFLTILVVLSIGAAGATVFLLTRPSTVVITQEKPPAAAPQVQPIDTTPTTARDAGEAATAATRQVPVTVQREQPVVQEPVGALASTDTTADESKPRAVEATVEPRPLETPQAPAPTQETAAPVQVAAVENKPSATELARATVQSEPVQPETTRPDPIQAPPAQPVHRPEAKAPSATRNNGSGDPEKLDLMSLPMLSESARLRLGLPELKINVLGRPSEFRPVPSAMINYKRVMLNETIPGTNITLVAVDIRGVAVEVNGERYFLPK